MRRSFLSLCLLASWALLEVRSEAAAPPQRPEPLKGVVVSGKVIVCTKDRSDSSEDLSAWFQPLRGGRPAEVDSLTASVRVPIRWHVGHGALWVAGSAGDSLGGGPGRETAKRYELAELFAGRRVIGPKAKPAGWYGDYFIYPDPIYDARFLSDGVDFDPMVHYDYLPAAPDTLKLFLLTNVGGRGKPLGGKGKVVARAFPRHGKLQWSFTCYSFTADWDPKEEGWYSRPEVEECTLDLVFREPFQALSRGEDYYFLTASGKLYRAPRPAKGKHRKLETIWDDKRSPIAAHLHDADRGRTFLFCDSGPKGKGGPCVFELASGVRPRFYDRALFRAGDQGPESLRRVLGYARVLQALGYIKDAKAPAQPKKDGKQTDRGAP
jgi:hypothetical protein